jgi:hypothetical protein
MVIGKRVLLIIVLLLPIMLFSQARVILNEAEGIDLIGLMEKSQLFITRIQDVALDDVGSLYILDDKACEVVRVDLRTGALVNRISSMGQGPAELMMPSVVRVHNQNVYVLNVGSKSIKTFTVQGEYLGGFKTQGVPLWMDVDKQGHLYIAEADRDSSPLISVYDAQGKREKTLETFRLNKEALNDRALLIMRQQIKFRVDSKGNIIALFKLMRELNKVDPNGHLIWQRKIVNSTLKPFLKDEGIEFDERGWPTIGYVVNSFDIDRRDNVIIGHVGGGCVYDPDGNLKYLLEVRTRDNRNSAPGLVYLKVLDERLLGVYVGGRTIIFSYKLI